MGQGVKAGRWMGSGRDKDMELNETELLDKLQGDKMSNEEVKYVAH